MAKYKLTIEYDGGPFVGWQRQTNGPSVQEALEIAVHRFCGETVNAFAAGRTDAGVHALAMVVHIDLEQDYRADVVRDALNYHLRPAPIAVLAAEVAAEDFHARFSCNGRRYEYRVVNRRAPLTLELGKAWRISHSLDVSAMEEAARSFVGRHDFTTFRAAACQASSPVKTLDAFSVSAEGERIYFRCAAPSFLHNQVRSMVGSLVEVGRNRWPVSAIAEALSAKTRARCGPVAPPDGLYFAGARYENN